MVQSCEEKVLVRLSKNNRDWLDKERQEFQKVIGGGKWSLNDAFSELRKILRTVKK